MKIKLTQQSLIKNAKKLLGAEFNLVNQSNLIAFYNNNCINIEKGSQISPSEINKIMDGFNKILGFSGVENKIGIKYCNALDSKNLTIIFFDGDFFIAELGEFVEKKGM